MSRTAVSRVPAITARREQHQPKEADVKHAELAALTYRIRDATPHDCRGLAEVQVDSYRTAYAGLFPPSYLSRFTYEEQAQEWHDLLAHSNAGTERARHADWSIPRVVDREDVLLVAVSPDGLVLGYILARLQPDVYPGYDAEIVAMHVRRPLQRQGTGAALLCAAVEALQQRRCRSVMLWTLSSNPVRAWYERLGGRLIGEQRFEVEGWEIVEVAYGWDTINLLQEKGKESHHADGSSI